MGLLGHDPEFKEVMLCLNKSTFLFLCLSVFLPGARRNDGSNGSLLSCEPSPRDGGNGHTHNYTRTPTQKTLLNHYTISWDVVVVTTFLAFIRFPP